MNFHFFHIVIISPWPYLASLFSFFMLYRVLFWFSYFSLFWLVIFSFVIFVSFNWWRDVLREALSEGKHSIVVLSGLKIGMLLFIVREGFFFFSFFWGYYHFGLRPSVDLGQWWPPLGVQSFNPVNVPFLNTLILLSSGVSVTLCHHGLFNGNIFLSLLSIIFTLVLGLYFTLLQYVEYSDSFFCISDSTYGSIFFLATGFHGLHVLLGTVFLFVSFFRIYITIYRYNHMLGFEAAAWYWHFVDVVWLFLYLSIYWWGWFKKSFKHLISNLNIILKVISLLILCLIVSCGFIFISNLISFYSLRVTEKGSCFECGYLSLTESRVSFSVRFFLFCLVFLLFDVEVSILLPLFYFLNYFIASLIGIFFFLFILFYGLYFEWLKGVFDWL